MNQYYLSSTVFDMALWVLNDVIYCEWLPDDELFVYAEEDITNREVRLDG